jgi:uncharacterized FAD-dependent dehydrogenase
MLRLTELKLPLDHPPEALRAAILKRLELADDDLVRFSIFKRSYDARKKHALLLIYAVDVEVRDEAALRKKFRNDHHLAPTPDMDYRFVGRAPENLSERPLVVGFGPCGIFAALVLAQMGFRPIVLERGKAVRERTQDTWGLWRKLVLNPESNVQFGEGGAGTFSDGKLYSQIKDPRHLGRKVLTGVETRTSSPLRITRGDDCQSLSVKGLYPGGEGAGYAGGILSAGVDGIRVAEAVARDILNLAE